MAAILHYYGTNEVDADRSADIAWKKQISDREIKKIYDVHVDPLFQYGMHACGDRELVMHSLQELFVGTLNCRQNLIDNQSVRFDLFKRFRGVLLKGTINQDKPANTFFVEKCSSRTGLCGSQREAVFLKISTGFSYKEVARIMKVKPESVFVLISQSMETLTQTMKGTDKI